MLNHNPLTYLSKEGYFVQISERIGGKNFANFLRKGAWKKKFM